MKKEYETPTIIELYLFAEEDLLSLSDGDNGVDTPGGQDSGIGL